LRIPNGILATVLTATAYGQSDRGLTQRISDLEHRVQQLERENRNLRGTISVMPYIQQALDGHRVEVKRGDSPTAELIIARDGWGESRPQDIAAVSRSVAQTVFSAIQPIDTPSIIIARSEHGPRTVAHRGPKGEYIVLLDTADRHWAQLAYQLAHEIGHVLCRDLDEDAPQHWFEEAFCEALSLWTIDEMAESWKTTPPYESWTSYASSLAKYVEDVRSKIDRPANIRHWYASHRKLLDRESYDRAKNRVIAEQLAVRAHRQPEYLRAFLYLREEDPASNTIESLMAVWLTNCPEDVRFVPREMAQLLGVAITP